MLGFCEDITLYSHWRNGKTDKWIRTQLRDTSWYGKQASSVADAGLATADKYVVRVLEDEMGTYITPDEWNAMTFAPSGVWTVQPGDIAVKGLADDEITTGPTQVTGKYKACFTVTAAYDNRRGFLEHLRIEGE